MNTDSKIHILKKLPLGTNLDDLFGKIKTVNDILPDENGNVKLPIDDDFSKTSENPIKNCVISKRNDAINDQIQRHEFSIQDIYDALHYLKIWIIRTPADLVELQRYYAEEHPSEDNRIFALQVADIDMTGISWKGIGENGYPFRGTYNGNYYKITGLTLDASNVNKNTYCALFAYADHADFTNIRLNVAGFNFPAGFAINKEYSTLDALKADSKAKVENVLYVLDTEDVDNRKKNGKKFIYRFDSTVNDFVVYEFGGAGLIGNVTGNIDKDPSARVLIKNVVIDGDIGSRDVPCSHNAAGFVVKGGNGTSENAKITFTDCINNVNVYGSYTKTGGFIAYAEHVDLEFNNCVNNGNIFCAAITTNGGKPEGAGTGGFLGWGNTASNAYNNLIINNCKNTGIINSRVLDIGFDGSAVVAANQIYCGGCQVTFITPFYGNDKSGFKPSSYTVKGDNTLQCGWLGEYCEDGTVKLVDVSKQTNFDGKRYMVAETLNSDSTIAIKNQTDPKIIEILPRKMALKTAGKQTFNLNEQVCELPEYKIIMKHTGEGTGSEEKVSDTEFKYSWN